MLLLFGNNGNIYIYKLLYETTVKMDNFSMFYPYFFWL